jgi:hypothetical protein
LPGQHGDAGLLALLDLLRVLLPRQRLLDRKLGDGLAGFDVLVEPDLEGVAHHAGHQLHRLARVELFLDLALELRVEDARREDEGHAPADVVLLQLDAARQQRVVFDEGLDGLEDAGAQAGFVGAAGHGGDQVDVGLGGHGIDMNQPMAQAAPSPAAKSAWSASAYFSAA